MPRENKVVFNDPEHVDARQALMTNTALKEGIETLQELLERQGDFADALGGSSRNLRNLLKSLQSYNELLETGRLRLEDLRKVQSLLEKTNKELLKLDRDKLVLVKQDIDNLKEKVALSKQEVSNIVSGRNKDNASDFFKILGVGSRNLQGFTGVLSMARGVAYKLFGVALPMTVLDAVKTIAKFVVSLDRLTMETNKELAPAFVQTAILTRYGAKELELQLKSAGSIISMSAKDMVKTFVEMRESGLLYTTDFGKDLLRLQQAIGKNSKGVDGFGSGLTKLNVLVRGLADATGRTKEEVIRFLSVWRPLLLTKKMDDVKKAFATVYAYTVRTGLGYKKLVRILESTMQTERLYGMGLESLLPAIDKYKKLFQDSIITVDEFKHALDIVKEEINPEQSGTSLYYLAHFADNQDIKNFASKLLERGGEGILEFNQFLKYGMKDVQESWKSLPDEAKKRFMDLYKSLGLVKNGVIDWDKGIKLQANAQESLYTSILNLSKKIGGGSGTAIYLFEQLEKTIGNTRDTFLTASRDYSILGGAIEGFGKKADFSKESMKHYQEVMDDSRKIMENSKSAIKEANAGLAAFGKTLIKLAGWIDRNIINSSGGSIPEPPTKIEVHNTGK